MSSDNIIKILFCGPLGHGTGADVATYELLLALGGLGCDVSAIVDSRAVHLPEGCRALPFMHTDSYPVACSVRSLPLHLLGYMNKSVYNMKQARRQCQLRYDVLLVNDAQGHRMLASVNMENFSRKWLVLSYLPDYMGAQDGPISDALNRNLKELALYDGYIAITHAVADAWRDAGAIGDKPVWVVPNCGRDDLFCALNSKERNDLRRELRLPLDKKILVCPGSLQFRKGQDLLLKAFALLPRDVQESLCILFLGTGDGYYVGYLEQLAGKCASGQVQFLGFCENVCEYVRCADAVVIPSRSEAQGITVLEGMALKTLVIASRTGGIPEMIEHGVHGYLFETDDCDSLSQHLLQVARVEKEEIDRMVACAYERYWAEFTRQQCQEKWGDCVTGILNHYAGCSE